MAKKIATPTISPLESAIRSLYCALLTIESAAGHLYRLSKGQASDPIFWKRLRSTEFAANKQKGTLSTILAGMTEGKTFLLAETIAPTIDASSLAFNIDGFRALNSLLLDAQGKATQLATIASGDLKDRAAAIDDSMAKQSILLGDYAAAAFRQPLIPAAKPTLKKAKA